MADVPLVRSIEKTRARVDSLRVHPRNPRTISPARMEQLQRTLEAEPDMPVDERIYWLTRGRFVFANDTATKSLGTIWQITPRAEVQASAPFPIEVPTRCLAACSQTGDGVLDPYAGSGTTLIAAEMADRRCFAMEIDPAYCDVIRQRYADYTGQPEYAP